jgi:hypothetical protein
MGEKKKLVLLVQNLSLKLCGGLSKNLLSYLVVYAIIPWETKVNFLQSINIHFMRIHEEKSPLFNM